MGTFETFLNKAVSKKILGYSFSMIFFKICFVGKKYVTLKDGFPFFNIYVGICLSANIANSVLERSSFNKNRNLMWTS